MVCWGIATAEGMSREDPSHGRDWRMVPSLRCSGTTVVSLNCVDKLQY